MKTIFYISLLKLKTLLLLLSTGILTSCNYAVTTVEKDSLPNSFEVSSGEALIIGNSFQIHTNHSNSTVSPHARLKAEDLLIENIETITEDSKATFFIINYKNGKGWTIVSADRRAAPVLAYSDHGYFEVNNMPDGVKDWVSAVKGEIKTAKATLKESHPLINRLWQKFEKELQSKSNARVEGGCYTQNCNSYLTPCQTNYSTSTGILLRDKWNNEFFWGQGAGFNHFSPARSCGPCGKAYAGCGPVALAMVMRYYKYPSGYNYDSMPTNLNAVCSGLLPQELEVARLIRQCGIWGNSSYNMMNCNTYTWSGNLDEVFEKAGYRYKGELVNFHNNLQRIKNELKAKRPVILVGSTCNTCMQDAHEWVLDGYQENHYFDLDCCSGYKQCTESSYAYYHLNWGWQGRNNGWYVLNNFIGNGSHYSYWLRAQVGMMP